jgi:hypothetical protein
MSAKPKGINGIPDYLLSLVSPDRFRQAVQTT